MDAVTIGIVGMVCPQPVSELFREMPGYIVTDGVLLGSYKFGGMLDWDADVVWS